jgi:aminoglycoside phosphotransferase family enzyme/predicted kinase
MALDDQSEAIAFLSNPASHAGSGAVERIETHISVVFLAGEQAFKLKKSLKLPYLDFSTSGLRDAACREEVALNSVTAPALYLGVRRITRGPDGGLEWDGPGVLVETVVLMQRFDQDHLLDRVAARGALSDELMTATARMIADFHGMTSPVSGMGGTANIAGVLDINDAGFATSQVFAAEEVSALGQALRARLARHADLLDARAAAGKIRRCHGDLHLRNICLIEAQPCLFDCIEFSAQIATIDVLYDLAFLLMDLWHRGLHRFANLVMNRYLDEADEADGFSLLPFFMAVRAAVRAHVTATQAEEAGQDRARLVQEARSYFSLAGGLLEEERPRLVAIGGLSGSGKSTVAQELAPLIGSAPGARILESDRIRKAMHGVSADTHLAPSAYAPEVSVEVYHTMARMAADILAQGGCALANAVFDDPARRTMIAQAASAKASFCGFWLETDPALLRQRVAHRHGGPSDADVTVLDHQLQKPILDMDWQELDAALPLDRIVAQILQALAGTECRVS